MLNSNKFDFDGFLRNVREIEINNQAIQVSLCLKLLFFKWLRLNSIFKKTLHFLVKSQAVWYTLKHFFNADNRP